VQISSWCVKQIVVNTTPKFPEFTRNLAVLLSMTLKHEMVHPPISVVNLCLVTYVSFEQRRPNHFKTLNQKMYKVVP